MALSGCWWLEWGEMDALSRSEVTRVKGFITSSKDRYRPPYERREVDVYRRCVFVGTTNQYEYLKDSTGGRRFWCVRIDGEVDLDRLRRERDQLFAEAVHRFNAGRGLAPHVAGAARPGTRPSRSIARSPTPGRPSFSAG